ncbi:hypothetical protein D3C79_787950 [compost metagenome]
MRCGLLRNDAALSNGAVQVGAGLACDGPQRGPSLLPSSSSQGFGWQSCTVFEGQGEGCACRDRVGLQEIAQYDATTIDTRRFSVRPALLRLSATGWVLPRPRVWMFCAGMPIPISVLATLCARRSDNCWL